MSENKRASAPWVDPDDAPDLSKLDPAQGVWSNGPKAVSPEEGLAAMARARRGRPAGSVQAVTKQPVTLRMDADALAAWRASGKGWQTRAAAALAALAPKGNTTA